MNHQLFWQDENEHSFISPVGSPCSSRVERSFGSRFLEIPPDGWNAFETQSTPKSNSSRTPEHKLEHEKKTRIEVHKDIGLPEDETSSIWSSATPSSSSFPIRLSLRPVHIEEEQSFESSFTFSSASNPAERSFGSGSFEILRDEDAFAKQSTQESNSNRTPENKLEHGKTAGIEVGQYEYEYVAEYETGPSASSSPELPIPMKLSLGAQVVNKITELIGDLSLNYEEKIQRMSKYIESAKRRESELVVTISSIQQKYDKVLSDFQELNEEHSKLQQRNAKMETIKPGSGHVLLNCECSGELSTLNEVSILNTKPESTASECQFEQKVKNIVSAGTPEEGSQGKGSQPGPGSDNVGFFMDEYTSLVSSCCGSHMGFQNREDPRMIVCNSVCLSVMNNGDKLKRTAPHTEPTEALVAQTEPIISPEWPWKEHPGTVPSSDNMFTDSGEYKSEDSNGGKRNKLIFSPMPVSDFSSGMFTDSSGFLAADSTGGERNKLSISSIPVSDCSTWMFTDSVEYKSADNNGGNHNEVTFSPIPVSHFSSGILTDSGKCKSGDNNGGNHNQVSFSSSGDGSVRIGNMVELVSYPQKSSLEACQNKGRSVNEIDAKPKTELDIDFNRAIFKRDSSPAVAEDENHVTVAGCGKDSGQKSSASHTMSSPRTKVTSRRTQPWTCWRWNYRRSHTHEGRIARPKSTVLEN